MPRARALLMACHPGPTLAVTAIAGCLAVTVGLPAATVLLVIAAVGTGQLSIGWSNDLLDAERDRGRPDKPLAAGALDRRTVLIATAGALLLTVVCSVLLGGPAALAALLIVVCGWAYNLGLRATAASFLPYAVAFGALPAVATLALPGHPLPLWWGIAAGSMLGVAAHFVNVLPDLAQDAANGIRGLPHRCGPAVSRAVATGLILGAAAVLLFGPGGPVPVWRWIAFGVLAAGAVIGVALLVRRPDSRLFFRLVLLGAVIDVLVFALSGTGLVG